MTAQPGSITDAVTQYYASVSSGDVDRIASLFAPDAIMRDPVGSPALTDDAARRARYGAIAPVFSAFELTPELIIVGGDEAAVRWTARATTHAGKEARFEGMSTFTFDAGGKIASMSAYWDRAALAAALQ
jgi:steroid delta-isomerase